MQRNQKVAFIFTILIVLIGTTIHFFVPRIIVEIEHPLIQLIRGQPSTIDTEKDNKILFDLKSFDNTILSGYLIQAQSKPALGTIIYLHGIRGHKEAFLNISKQLSKRGYNSVALDSRGHNTSGGKFCTFGVKERNDISSLIDYLNEKGHTQNIGIWGQSLGGAIAIQAMATDHRIKFGIIESTFTNYITIVNDYFTAITGVKSNIITRYLSKRAAQIADFDPYDANPRMYCKQIEQHILLVHGSDDERIDIMYAKQNYQDLKSGQKEFLIVPDAHHLDLWKVGGEKYFKTVFSFIEKNTKP